MKKLLNLFKRNKKEVYVPPNPDIKLVITEELKRSQHVTSADVMPMRANPGDAGIDLRAFTPDLNGIVIKAGETALISTGYKIAIPKGHVGYVCSRSGLAAKNSVIVLNAPGVVDSGYRGELKVILKNLGEKDFLVEPAARIAQLVVMKVEELSIDVVPAFDDETKRGEGGFGSTGFNGLAPELLTSGVMDPVSIQAKAAIEEKQIKSKAQGKHDSKAVKSRISMLREDAEERLSSGRDYNFTENELEKHNKDGE